MADVEPDAPLFVVAEHILGEPDLGYVAPYTRLPWTAALRRWYGLNHLLLDRKRAPFFPECLSKEQFHSFRVLREWWTAQYQLSEASLACILEIVDRCDTLRYTVEEETDMTHTLRSLQLVRWPVHDIICDETKDTPRKTVYNSTMMNLFMSELVGDAGTYRYSSAGRIQKRYLVRIRQVGMQRAYCQHLAMATLDAFCDTGKDPDEVSEYSLKSALMESDFKNDIALTLQPSPLERGPILAACSWLMDRQSSSQKEMPYYLWDRSTYKTTVTSTLCGPVEYTAISHTWGRFRKGEAPVSIDGVPWLIPENTRFDVHKLGEYLDSLDCKTRYIWMDLLCIPQDRSAIGIAEIARQAEIYSNAKHAVAWLSDVEEFECLESVVTFMALRLLWLPKGSEEETARVRAMEAAWERVAYKSTGLLEPRVGRLSAHKLRCNVWFSSLWTLQELCLRPDMWICSSSWKPVSIAGQPISIVGMITIWNYFWREYYLPLLHGRRSEDVIDGFDPFNLDHLEDLEYNQSHVGFVEFYAWVECTSLDKLVNLSRARILSLGDKRTCKRGRAEAIMSVLGSTDWYKNLPQHLHETDLVLGKYPKAFLEELRQADPGSLFCHIVKFDSTTFTPEGRNPYVEGDRNNQPDKSLPTEFGHIVTQPWGSFLPFSRHGAVFMDTTTMMEDDHICHDSVKAWTIHTDGRVHLPTACILASSTRPLDIDRRIIYTYFTGFETTKEFNIDSHQVDLEAWTCSRTFEVHAVVITHRSFEYKASGNTTVETAVHGAVLAKLNDELYVRLGGFDVMEASLSIPAACKTDWLVA